MHLQVRTPESDMFIRNLIRQMPELPGSVMGQL
jgi:hypothetical protein